MASLRAAISNGFLEVVEQLISKGIFDVNVFGDVRPAVDHLSLRANMYRDLIIPSMLVIHDN